MPIEPGRELLILGILRRAQMSAYDVSRAVKMHSLLYRDLARGNVYAQLSRLSQSGAIYGRHARAARGPQPSKTVYSLSPKGRRRFEALLDAVMTDVQSADATVEVACVLLGALSRERARELLARRLGAILAQERRLTRLSGAREERSGAGELALTHAIARLRAESGWLRESIALLRGSKWRSQWRDEDPTGVDRRLP